MIFNLVNVLTYIFEEKGDLFRLKSVKRFKSVNRPAVEIVVNRFWSNQKKTTMSLCYDEMNFEVWRYFL